VATVGPAVVAEPDCTIWIPAGWRADPGRAGALMLTRVANNDASGETPGATSGPAQGVAPGGTP
jgi:hypothetical protein